MNAAARQLVTATLTAAAALDPTLTADRQAAALDALEGKTIAGIVDSAPMPRILSTTQTAELLHMKPDSVRLRPERQNPPRLHGRGKKQTRHRLFRAIRPRLSGRDNGRPPATRRKQGRVIATCAKHPPTKNERLEP